MIRHLAANKIEPEFALPERQGKRDPFAQDRAGWLSTDASKSREQRRTVKHRHADLVGLGVIGPYRPVPSRDSTLNRPFAPPQRHATAFAAIDPLAPGKTFVLINDQAPVPLLNRIESRHPGAFTHEYRQDGLVAWQVAITRANR